MSTPQSLEAMIHDYQDSYDTDMVHNYQDASEFWAETPAQLSQDFSPFSFEGNYDDSMSWWWEWDLINSLISAQAHAESNTPQSSEAIAHNLGPSSDPQDVIDLCNSDDEQEPPVRFQLPFYDFLQVQTANVSTASHDPSPVMAFLRVVLGDNGSDRNALLDILMDPTAEARDLPLSLFKDITGNFSDEHIIGRGGFGVVYKGMLQNGQRVAVKRLQAHMVDDTRFHTEVNFMKKLDHKNIVRFLAYCVHTEKVEYIKDNGGKDEAEIRERLLCFEYVPHGTIKEHIADESFGLEWPKRYQIIKGICDGLDYIHNVGGIVHLDIKPDNILLDDNIVPKIADFGLSRLVADYSKRTTKNIPGTLGYMAPEYMFYGKISRKADIFGLGRIIFELVTGSKGPETDEKDNFLEKVLTSWSKVLSTSHSGYSFELAINQVEACIEIALNCTEHDPDKRLDISQILIDLEKVGDYMAKADLLIIWPRPRFSSALWPRLSLGHIHSVKNGEVAKNEQKPCTQCNS